jgi:hypothetical protein
MDARFLENLCTPVLYDAESTNPVIVNNGLFVCGVCLFSLFDG